MIAIQFFYSVFKLQAISACCMFLFSIFMFSENDLIARQSGIDTQLEKLLEDFDPEEFELSPEQIIEYIQDLASNPVNINRATLDDLLAIPFISFVNAQNIISYRDENPPFTSIDEITNVPGIGTVTFEKIRPFISVGSGGQQIKDLYLNPDYWTKNLQFESINRYQKTLETREGFRRKAADGGFTGSPGRYYQRFRIRSDHLSLNLTQEKDPGEPVQFPAKFDHNSWHIAALNNGLIKTIVAGDYSVSFGQGLILWNGGSFGKGRDVTRTQLRNSRDIRPYTSAQETNAFRGIAATIGNRFQVTGFYSNRYRTATVVDDQTVRMPQNSGLHRTLSERERRFNLNQKTYGGRVRLQLPFGLIGAGGFKNEFDKQIDPGTQLHQKHRFSGRTLTALSFDYQLALHSFQFFGESGITDNKGFGIISGLRIRPEFSTEIVLLYRKYGRKFQSIFGSAFGEQSGIPQNEEGFYFGIRQPINSKLLFAGYADQFHFPAPRFGTTQATNGFDWLAFAEYNPTRELNIYVLGRSKSRDDEFTSTDSFGRSIRITGKNSRTGLRLNFSYQATNAVRLQSRFEWVQSKTADHSVSEGYLFYQDIRITPVSNLQIDARITLFDTDGFQSRIFQFESDLLHVFSNTALFDQGQRIYLVVKYSFFNNLDVQGKIASSLFENRNVISSGLNQIDGNRRTDVGVLARLRF